MVDGYRHTCLVVAALQSGVIDRLEEGPVAPSSLARELELDESALGRFLRALKTVELVQVGEDGSYSLSPEGRFLTKTGFGAGLRAWAELVGAEYYRSWGSLARSLKTGRSAFRQEFGMDVCEHRRLNPELGQAFQRVASGEQRRTLSRLLRSYNFPPGARLVDVGGGRGDLLQGILQKYPEATGVLYDLPQVVEGLVASTYQIEGGSFLERVPPGGDCYLLKHVLHNWDDPHCVSILKNCEKAVNPDGRILILENLLTEDDAAQVLMDMHMLAVLGGRERSEAEYVSLLHQAGLELVQCRELGPGLPVVMEAKKSL